MQNLTNEELLSDGLERISDAAKFLGVSRSKLYGLIKNGTLPSVKIGKSRRVPIRAVRELARSKHGLSVGASRFKNKLKKGAVLANDGSTFN